MIRQNLCRRGQDWSAPMLDRAGPARNSVLGGTIGQDVCRRGQDWSNCLRGRARSFKLWAQLDKLGQMCSRKVQKWSKEREKKTEERRIGQTFCKNKQD